METVKNLPKVSNNTINSLFKISQPVKMHILLLQKWNPKLLSCLYAAPNHGPKTT